MFYISYKALESRGIPNQVLLTSLNQLTIGTTLKDSGRA